MTAGAPTAVDPCPTELELELPAHGRLVFVSDVHLTGGGPVADFGAAGEFVELVDGLGRHDGEVLLVLGGDILDLLQAGGPPAEAVDRILGAGDAEAVARALREAAGRPRVRVVYLVGNHDAALAWHGAARRRVAAALGVTAVALRARITVRCQDGEAVTVLAEHGHALDVYNRHTDPFDPLDTPAGDHVVQEVVNRFDSLAPTRPDLALDQIDNVRPSSAVPLWLVSNFFYRFLRRTLRRFALPLFALFLLLHLPAVSLALRDLQGRTEEVERVVYRGLWWLVVIVAIDLVLLVALSAFLGRSLREAAAVYGGTPDDAESDLSARAAAMGELLAIRDPDASVLLTGHTHRFALVPDGHGRVVADAGCWVRALVPVRAWLSLPPVFVPAYPCTWIEVAPGAAAAAVRLWERPLAAAHRLSVIERLAMRDRPRAAKPAPARVTAEAAALPRPGPVRPEWSTGAAQAPSPAGAIGSQRWAGVLATDEPAPGQPVHGQPTHEPASGERTQHGSAAGGAAGERTG